MVRHLRALFLIAVAALTLTYSGGIANAQAAKTPASTPSGSNGLRISPVRSDLTIKPGESANIALYIQNITDLPAELKGVINDFVPSADESGTPRLLLNDNDKAPSHGLKQYVADIGNVTLQPQEQKTINVKISIPAKAAGGGYYGAIRFLPASADDSKTVSLSASVGSLVLVTVPGDVKEQASLASFNVSHDGGKASNFFTNGGKDSKGKGLQVTMRFQNSGNVQVAPFGKLQLKKGSATIASVEVNDVQPRGTVLPDSIRKFTADLGTKTKSIGKYTIQGNFGYGNGGQLLTASTSFYVVPLPYIIIAVGVLLLIIAAILILPRWLKSHDRKLTRKLRGTRR